MLKFISLRLLFALPALWLILTMVFLLAHIVPGDPVQQMLGEGARTEELQQLRHALGLDLPLDVQYGRYLGGVVRGNLGESAIRHTRRHPPRAPPPPSSPESRVPPTYPRCGH